MKCRSRKQFIPTVFAQTSIRPSGAAPADHFVVYQLDAELINARLLDLISRNSILPTNDFTALKLRPFSDAQANDVFAVNNAADSLQWFHVLSGGLVRCENGLLARALSDKPILKLLPFSDTQANDVFAVNNAADSAQWFAVRPGGLVKCYAGLRSAPTNSIESLRLVPSSDAQAPSIFIITNAAESIAWLFTDPSGQTTIRRLLVKPLSDIGALVITPSSDANANAILNITNAAVTVSWLLVGPSGQTTIRKLLALPTADAESIRITPFSDAQASSLLNVTNAAQSASWLFIGPSGLTTLRQFLATPLSDLVAGILRPFSDAQASDIFNIQNAAGTSKLVSVGPTGSVAMLPGSDIGTLFVRPFSNTQGSDIFAVQDNPVTKNLLAVKGSGQVQIGTGIQPDSGGVKHTRVTWLSLSPGANTTVTITWGTAFADANYTVTIGLGPTVGEHTYVITSQAAGSIQVQVFNKGVGSDGGGIVNAIAFHD